MNQVTLAGTDLDVSRLSFGTASLHHIPTTSQRQALLAAIESALQVDAARRTTHGTDADLQARFAQLTPREREVFVDYVGFEIEDEFVIGYGLDYIERFREQKFIGILDVNFIYFLSFYLERFP